MQVNLNIFLTLRYYFLNAVMVTRFNINGAIRGFVRNPHRLGNFICPKLFKSNRSLILKNFQQQQRSFCQRKYKVSLMDEAPAKRSYEVNFFNY